MGFESDDKSAEETLKKLIESAGEERVKKSGKTKLKIDRAHSTLESLVEEAGLADQQDAGVSSRRSTRRAMHEVFTDPQPSVDIDLNRDDGIIDENGEPTYLNEASLPPKLAGTEPTPPPRPIRELEDDIDFWLELENDPPEDDEE